MRNALKAMNKKNEMVIMKEEKTEKRESKVAFL